MANLKISGMINLFLFIVALSIFLGKMSERRDVCSEAFNEQWNGVIMSV